MAVCSKLLSFGLWGTAQFGHRVPTGRQHADSGYKLFEWSGEPFKLQTNVHSSLYFTITGFHMLHVIVGLLMLAVLLLWTAFEWTKPRREGNRDSPDGLP